MKVLILGLGNILMKDDGLGPRVVEALGERYRFSPEVELIDGGTLGLDLLPRFEGRDRLLIIDALEMAATPGEVRRIAGPEAPRALGGKVSVHQMGVQDLLAVAELQGQLPSELVIWGVQPRAVDLGLELSPEVEAAIPEIVSGIVRDLSEWGLPPSGRK